MCGKTWILPTFKSTILGEEDDNSKCASKYGITTYRQEMAYCGMLPHSEFLLAIVSPIPTIR